MGLIFGSATSLATWNIANRIYATTINSVSDFEYAFYDNEYKNEPKTLVEITKYIGRRKDVVIPEVIEEKKVTRISSRAFYASPIKSIVIPESVYFISSEVFGNCKNLKKVTISGLVLGFDSNVFKGCNNLSSIVFSKDIIFFSKPVFSGCSNELIVTCENNSIIFRYCIENNIKTKIPFKNRTYRNR